MCRKHRRVGVICFTFLVLISLLIPVIAQNANAPSGEAPLFRSTARLVLVDVVVTDSKGEPVTGLTEKEFVLLEDGKEQKIRSFEAHSAPAMTSVASSQPVQVPQLPPHVYTNAPLAKAAGPLNVVLFDVLNSSPQSAGYARQQALKFLEQLPPNQPMALYFLGSRLRMLQAPTGKSDELIAAAKKLLYEKVALQTTEGEVRNAMNEMQYNAEIARSAHGTPNTALVQQMGQALKDESAQFLQHRVDYTAAALRDLAESLSAYPGRKNVIWLTESFPLSVGPDAGSADPMRNADNYLNSVHALGTILANKQIALYPIDIGGMRTRGPDASAAVNQIGLAELGSTRMQADALASQFGNEEANRATMINMADETGGRAFFRTNDLRLAAEKAITAGASYYTLAYTPTNSDWRGQYRNIKVKLSRPDLKLEYRRGYNAYLEGGQVNAEDSRKLLAVAMQPDRVPYTGVQFKAQVLPDPKDSSKIVITYIIDASTVTFIDTSDGRKSVSLDFLAVAAAPNVKDAGHSSGAIETAVKPETYQAVLRSGIPTQLDVTLKPGSYVLRLGVIDRNSRQIGTLAVPVAVP